MAVSKPPQRPPSELKDRELLEEIATRLRRWQPLLDAAERHPLLRRFLNGVR